MKVIGRPVLEDFKQRHADIASQLDSWLNEALVAAWKEPADVKARYVSASFIGDNRVIFNLKGNKYRLEAKINYIAQTVLIKRVGTHAEYSKWDS
jgi:mRNA interferase HigB